MKRLTGILTACAVLTTLVGASAGESLFRHRTTPNRHAPIRQVAGTGPTLIAPWKVAQAPPAAPAPEGEEYIAPTAPMPMGEPVPMGEPIPMGEPFVGGEYAPMPQALFHNVEYEDLDNIHPCAIPIVVSVADPCERCCGPSCVLVQICVPPCECVKVKHSKDGRKVKYDYGEYTVQIKSEDGVVSVDYDD